MIGCCLSLLWHSWRDRGEAPWVVEVLKLEYVIPFHSVLPLSGCHIALDLYSPKSIMGRALEEEIQSLRRKGAVEPVSPSPGFYSHMVAATKASGGWKPIIDLSTLNLLVVKTCFRMETAQSVLHSMRRNDWMVSIDVKDAYFQIPIHPSSHKFLKVLSQREGLAVQGPLLRSVHGATGVQTGHGSCVRFPPTVRRSDALLSGRLADSSFVSLGRLLGKGQGPESLSGFRDCSEFGKVFSRSDSDFDLSGDQDQVADFPSFANSLED